MSDNFFEDEEYGDSDVFSSKVSSNESENICRVTVLSVSPAELSGRIVGFAKRLLNESDVILANTFEGELAKFAKRHKPSNAVSLSTHRKIGSDIERYLFDLTTDEIAKVGLALSDVKIAQADIGACWALGLRAAIFRELYAAYTVDKILEEKPKRMVVLLPGLTASDIAMIARLMDLQAEGKVELHGVCELRKGNVTPVKCDLIHKARKALSRRRNENDFSVIPTRNEKLVGLPKSVTGDRPTKADVLFMHISDNPMFQRNIPPVIDAVIEKKNKPAVLIFGGQATEVYSEKISKDKIYKFNPKVVWDDQRLVGRISAQISTRVEVATQGFSPLKTWAPLLTALDNLSINASVKKLLIFQSAMNLMHGWVKPQSIYITQSPDTNLYAYLAMSSSRGQCNFFYSFSSLLNESTRSLPFVAPANLLAYGEQDHQVIQARNEKLGAAVNIVGTPSYDVIPTLDATNVKKHLLSELKLPKSGKVIVLMTSRNHPELEDVWLARFLRWANDEGIICILVKGRRAGTKDYSTLEAMAEQKKWERVRFIYHNRINAIACADVVVTDQAEAASEATAEAILLDKTLVHVSVDETSEGTSGAFEGVGFEVSSELELRDAINGIFMDDDFLPESMKTNRENLKKWINGENDGKSAEKLASFLVSEKTHRVDFDDPFVERFILREMSSPVQYVVRPANFDF